MVTLIASRYNLERMVKVADVLIGAVLEPRERASIYVTRQMVKTMKSGSLVIDLAIDQGGCIETSRLTTLDHPTYLDEGINHYCVPNITSSVSRSTTKVLSNLVTPFLMKIGDVGIKKALLENPTMARSVYIYEGQMIKKKIAERFNLPFKEINSILQSG